jgi:uncharacterized protein (DUF2267 family)
MLKSSVNCQDGGLNLFDESLPKRSREDPVIEIQRKLKNIGFRIVDDTLKELFAEIESQSVLNKLVPELKQIALSDSSSSSQKFFAVILIGRANTTESDQALSEIVESLKNPLNSHDRNNAHRLCSAFCIVIRERGVLSTKNAELLDGLLSSLNLNSDYNEYHQIKDLYFELIPPHIRDFYQGLKTHNPDFSLLTGKSKPNSIDSLDEALADKQGLSLLVDKKYISKTAS